MNHYPYGVQQFPRGLDPSAQNFSSVKSPKANTKEENDKENQEDKESKQPKQAEQK